MWVFGVLCLFVVGLSFENLVSADSDDGLTYVQLFRRGVTEYNTQKWAECINSFSKAIADYRFFKKQITACRRSCHEADLQHNFTSSLADDLESQFYEMAVHHTLCLVRCKGKHFGSRNLAYAPDVDDSLQGMWPYNYLQICYHKMGQTGKALSAAYTFLQRNPGHEDMQHNVKFYLTELSENADQYLVNLEVKPYQELFLQGMKAYDQKSYQAVMDFMERSLEEYLDEENQLRALCEGSFDQDGLQTDLYIALANHMTYTLKCRQRARSKLQVFDGFSGKDLLSKHFLYLQEAYEQLDQVKESLQAAASYLLFNAGEEEMLKKKDALLDLAESEKEWFEPRPDALKYFKRDQKEKLLLKNMESAFEVLIAEQREREFTAELRGMVGLEPEKVSGDVEEKPTDPNEIEIKPVASGNDIDTDDSR